MPKCPNAKSYPNHCPTENDHYWPTTACPGCPQLPTNTGYFHFQAPPACISLQFLGFLQGSEHQIKLVEIDSATSISKYIFHDFPMLMIFLWCPNHKSSKLIAKVKWENLSPLGIDWNIFFSPISHCLRLPVWLREWNCGGIVAHIDQGLTQKSGAPRGCDQFWKEMTLFSVWYPFTCTTLRSPGLSWGNHLRTLS